MADGEDMYFVLDPFVHNSIGAAEGLAKTINVVRWCAETFSGDAGADIREVNQLICGIVNLQSPSCSIFNRQFKSDCSEDFNEELLCVRRPVKRHDKASSRFQRARSSSILCITSSCGMPLPSANSRREMLMSRASSIWSKTLSRNSASTRYEAARPFWVMRTGRRVSRTRAIYVERLLRHSEKGITSSDGRQRRSGIFSVLGIESSPFGFVLNIVQNFALNLKRVA